MIEIIDIIKLIIIFFGIGILMNVGYEFIKDKMGWRPDYTVKVYRNARIPKNKITGIIQEWMKKEQENNPDRIIKPVCIEVSDGDKD